MKRELTEEEMRWLKKHGNRSVEEVEWDDGRPYVLMYSPNAMHGMERVYINQMIGEN